MSVAPLPNAVIDFCYLRLRGRRVFSALSDSYIIDVPALFAEWEKVSHTCCADVCSRVLRGVVESTVTEVKSRFDQFIAAISICAVFAYQKDNLANIFSTCKLLKYSIRPLLVSLYSESAASATLNRGANSSENSNLNISAQLLAPSAEKFVFSGQLLPPTKDGQERVCAGTSTPSFPKTQPRPQLLSFILPESREVSQILALCSHTAVLHKYVRGCCIRQIDDCCDLGLLQTALHRSRIKLLFVQRCVGQKIQELLVEQGVLCIHRLGTDTVQLFGQKLLWQVHESVSDWLLLCGTNNARKSWKFWLTAAQTRKGLRVVIHPKGATESSRKKSIEFRAPCSTHEQFFSNEVLKGTQAEVLLRKELIVAWEQSFLLQFQMGLAFKLSKRNSECNVTALISRLLEDRTLEAVLDSICLLCRYLM